jgi:hypothetical protein
MMASLPVIDTALERPVFAVKSEYYELDDENLSKERNK